MMNPSSFFSSIVFFHRFQDVVHAVMKFCSSDLCLLCGKGPGAKRAVEVAAKAWNEPGEG